MIAYITRKGGKIVGNLREIIRSNLERYLSASGYTQKDFAEKLGVSKSSVTNWIKGKNSPDVELVAPICKLLNITINDFYSDGPPTRLVPQERQKNAPLHSSEAEQLARDYDSLDVHGRKAVRAVADVEIARCAELAQIAPAREPDETVYYITSWFYRPMSAGTGEQAGNEQPENLRLVKEPPRGTSYVAPISGDSMEPTYHDGDKLFIRACEEIEPGQIGVFFMDGQQWVKELGDCVLISHNPSYPPRPMTEDIRCQGLVLGVCDESYFE